LVLSSSVKLTQGLRIKITKNDGGGGSDDDDDDDDKLIVAFGMIAITLSLLLSLAIAVKS